MPRSLSQPFAPTELKSLHRDESDRAEAVKNLHHVPLAMAKAKVGAAIGKAIGDAPTKEYGHEGLISGVKSGEKVPEYLARIVANRGACRRFLKALAADDTGIVTYTVMHIPDDEEKVG